MGSFYMSIEGVSVEGSSTIDIDTSHVSEISEKGLFSINSVSFGMVRNVSMELGNQQSRDGGIAGISTISCSRIYDGASEDLQKLFFTPGKEGKDVHIVSTKSGHNSQGQDEIYFHVHLEDARISSYQVDGSGGDLRESFELAFSSIAIQHWAEDEGGALTEGDKVAYDLGSKKLTSGGG